MHSLYTGDLNKRSALQNSAAGHLVGGRRVPRTRGGVPVGGRRKDPGCVLYNRTSDRQPTQIGPGQKSFFEHCVGARRWRHKIPPHCNSLHVADESALHAAGVRGYAYDNLRHKHAGKIPLLCGTGPIFSRPCSISTCNIFSAPYCTRKHMSKRRSNLGLRESRLHNRHASHHPFRFGHLNQDDDRLQ